jgi:hypothetical protein
MAHVRQQIRDYVADLLVNFIYDRFGIIIQDRFDNDLQVRNSGQTGSLYKFRRYALDEESLPALNVYTTSDISGIVTMGQKTISHNLELRVDIINKGASTSIFESVEQFFVDLMNKVEGSFDLSGLVKKSILASSEFSVKTDGEKAIGSGKIIFNMQYITAINNCQVSI